MLAADSHGAGIFSVSGPRFPAASSQVTAPSTAHRPVHSRYRYRGTGDTDTGAVEIQIQGPVEIHNYRYRDLELQHLSYNKMDSGD